MTVGTPYASIRLHTHVICLYTDDCSELNSTDCVIHMAPTVLCTIIVYRTCIHVALQVYMFHFWERMILWPTHKLPVPLISRCTPTANGVYTCMHIHYTLCTCVLVTHDLLCEPACFTVVNVLGC